MTEAYSENSSTNEKLSRFFYRLISEGLSLGADRIRFECDSELHLAIYAAGQELKRSTIKTSWFEMILAWLIDRTTPPSESEKRGRAKTHFVISGDASDDLTFVCYLPVGTDALRCEVTYSHQNEDGRVIELSGFCKHNTKLVTGAHVEPEPSPPKIEVADDFFMSEGTAVNNQVKAVPQVARILVVEDDVDQRSIIEMVLKDAGYEVFLAGDGREGFKVLEEKLPDLVISDLMMPEVDGAELIRKIKGDKRFSKLPILVLTVISDAEKEYLLLSLGVDDYCEKTIQRNILLKRIENLLRRSKS